MISLTAEEHLLLQSELGPSETVLWAGKSNPSIVFHSEDWYLIPFSLAWCGFALFWEFGASKSGSISFDLWGAMFILGGQYGVWGRFVYAAWRKKRVLYALTDKRALTVVRPPKARTISSWLSAIPGVEKQSRPDGFGTLTFGQRISGYRSQQSWNPLKLDWGIAVFVDIENVNDVYRLAQDAKERATR